MPFVYLTFRHSVRPEGGQAFPTFGIRCWKLGGAAGAVPVVCGQVCDVSPNEAFVKALAGRCTREGLEPCHLPCVVAVSYTHLRLALPGSAQLLPCWRLC